MFRKHTLFGSRLDTYTVRLNQLKPTNTRASGIFDSMLLVYYGVTKLYGCVFKSIVPWFFDCKSVDLIIQSMVNFKNLIFGEIYYYQKSRKQFSIGFS